MSRGRAGVDVMKGEIEARRADVGWVFIPGARRAHYFVRFRSLCGVWAYWGKLFRKNVDLDSVKCKKCRSEFDKRVVKEVVDGTTEEWLDEHDWREKGG